MEVQTTCPQCGVTSTLSVPEDGFRRWQNGTLIQVALPELSADEREQLITGIDGKCWDLMWSEADDDEA